MANKEKLLASAQKFLSKGQLPKAIGDYQKLVDAFPKDVRNRQKLAELLSRDRRNEEALIEYEVVAKHYTETGFYLKSIAVFKQMQKIEPSRVDIYHRLAELNEKQGLIGNALSEYRNLVSFYDKSEMYREAIEVLEKMADLDPDNLNFSAKIAEYLMVSGRDEEALEKFRTIVEPLAENAEHVKIIKLYERFNDLCPETGTSRLLLARSLLKCGSPDKAIQLLKGLLKHSPEDPDINHCLTDAYVANQDFASARLTLNHLLKQKAGDLDLCEYYVQICLNAGEMERARDRLEEWKDTFLQADRVVALQGLYEQLNELLPGDAVVAGTLSAIYEVLGDTAKRDELDLAVETSVETDVTADSALIDGAIDDVEAFDMVGEEAAFGVEVPPLDAVEFAEKPPEEKTAFAGFELDLDLDFATAVTQAENADSEAASPELIVEEKQASVADIDEDVEIEIDLDEMNELELEFDEESSEDDSQAFVGQDTVAEEDDLPADPETLADEGLQYGVTTETAAQSEEGLVGVDDSGSFVTHAGQADSEVLDVIEDLQPLPEFEEIEELELIEEFVAQNGDELEELEEIEELEVLEEVITSGSEEPSGKSDFTDSLNPEAELEEAEFYLHQGLYDDAERVVLTLMEYLPGLPELQVKMDEIIQARKAEETESENSAFVDIMSGLQDDDLLEATDFLDSFGDSAQGHDELSQKFVSELDSADTESHYDLGIAYKEMGLYADAIAEFEKAAKDRARHLDCTTLTGQCYLEAGETVAAMEVFMSGLSHEDLTAEGRMTLNFEVGMLHQLNGQLLDALEYFQLVAEKDSFFRNVSELIKNLRRELGLNGDSNDDGGPQGNRDRVSYI